MSRSQWLNEPAAIETRFVTSNVSDENILETSRRTQVRNTCNRSQASTDHIGTVSAAGKQHVMPEELTMAAEGSGTRENGCARWEPSLEHGAGSALLPDETKLQKT